MKRFVLDTNVLLHSSNAIFSFGNNEVILPIEVLEELDKFKRVDDELGRNAREVIRTLDKLRREGNFNQGVKLPTGGTLRIPTFLDLSPAQNDLGISPDSADNRMLMTVYTLQKQDPETEVIFISKDINLRVKANAFGIRAEDFIAGKVESNEIYPGWKEVFLSADEMQDIFVEGALEVGPDYPALANQFLLIRDRDNPSHSGLAIYKKSQGKIVPLVNKGGAIWSVRPRNKEQVMALHLLLDDSIKLVTLLGPAGTGKTLLALAGGLHKVLDEEVYTRMLISRPVMPLGRDLGYLPGSKEEKLSNWMGPIYDNLEFILTNRAKGRRKELSKIDVDRFIEEGIIEIEALTYMRGRSIPSQFILIDEAQNLSPHEIKTIISRVGEKSKIVLTGDPYQIDSPYLDAWSNGLTYCVEKLKGQELFGHILLSKSERSEIASLAAELL